MDKDYTKVVLSILALVLIIASIFGIKDLLHRREINKLLLVKPFESTVEQANVDKSNEKKNVRLLSSKSKKESTSTSDKDNNPDENSDMKIKNTSNNVTKKDINGLDLISDNDSSSNQDEAQAVDVNNLNTNINLDNIQLLARLIQSEAGDEPYQGKLAVGDVVLYRTNQDNTSLENTIFKKGQFDGVETNNFNIQPSEDCIRAATEVLNGKKVLSNGYYFVNLKVASPSWARSDNFIVRIGDHWFFRKES
ncbi:cell wall hydrolase [uncultured Clostridium sp.]|uniref:cell wall hydrolase n=1 Tax=uncultured Clostridium sp. TaxID=59620 RepID=UPI0028EAECFD|nr:cell wall hydrolase [uncultured Clostridium sp.]